MAAPTSPPSPAATRPDRLRLDIEPIIAAADGIAESVRLTMPGHAGLARAATGVARAAHEARRVSRALRRRLSWHRLPVYFLALTLASLGAWIYFQFFHTTTLEVALPERDAIELRARLAHRSIDFVQRLTPGSRQNAELVQRGEVDIAWVQGGVPVDAELPRIEAGNTELALCFARGTRATLASARKILTSSAMQGSHTVALDIQKAWRVDPATVSFVHDWSALTQTADWPVPSDVDLVFVVKDPADDGTLLAAAALARQGFRLVPLDLGARAAKLAYLQATTIPVGYFQADPPVPSEPVSTYRVSTYLVARKGLTPRLLATAGALIRPEEPSAAPTRGYSPTLADLSQLLQGVEAVFGIAIYVGVVFLALMGAEMLTYRKRFNELDSLASLISMHQSTKDVLGLTDPAIRTERLSYLSKCSDLLGLISVIAGYYSQENAALLWNGQLTIIHERCNALKLNIQLKILQAGIYVAKGLEPTSPAIEAPVVELPPKP